MNDAERIARGLQPQPYERTFRHPRYGDLTFRVERTPKAQQLLAHSVEMDNQLAALSPQAEPRVQTMILAAAIAGLRPTDPAAPGVSLMGVTLPVVREERREDPEDHRLIVERVFYDATEETSPDFLTQVWVSISDWRNQMLEVVDDVKGSSGATVGSSSSAVSSVSTVAPSTTP